jgi:hypothetical protein
MPAHLEARAGDAPIVHESQSVVACQLTMRRLRPFDDIGKRVYPTNALADDQQDSLAKLIQHSNRVPGVVERDGQVTPKAGADMMLWRLHAGVLDESREEIGGKSRGQTISKILERLPPKP